MRLLASQQTHLDQSEPHTDRGATMVEYGLLLTFIALVALLGATFLGTQLQSFFSSIGNLL